MVPETQNENRPFESFFSWPITLAVLLALAAALLAAGSTGLLAHPLRRIFMWVALGGAVAAGTAGLKLTLLRMVTVLVGIVATLALTASPDLPVNVLAVAVMVGLVGLMRSDKGGPALRVAALVVFLFATYRMLYTSVPTVWFFANQVGETLGRISGYVAGRELWVGATFGGVDFLVLMGTLYLAWLFITPPPVLVRGISAGLAICLGHLMFLLALALVGDVRGILEAIDEKSAWAWCKIFLPLLPWNLPVLAVLLHMTIAGFMLRWTPRWPGETSSEPAPVGASRPWIRPAVWAGILALAVALPMTLTLASSKCSLEGKKIVAYKECFGNWDTPRHDDYGRLSIGMYGMLGTYVRSLGGDFLLSDALSEEDLKDARVLVLLYPHKPWEKEQLDRIHKFVLEGGSLLLLGEHTTRTTPSEAITGHILQAFQKKTKIDLSEDYMARLHILREAEKIRYRYPWKEGVRVHLPDFTMKDDKHITLDTTIEPEVLNALVHRYQLLDNYFNEVLDPTAIRVRFDSSTFEVGGWLHSYTALSHPATAGVPDHRNQFGVVIGASLKASLPARPLLVGKWGWNDPGNEFSRASMMGNGKYDSGEKLGDVLLAAEQRVGKGSVVAFSDTSNMTNGITMGAYVFSSRMLAYLATLPGSPQDAWRQVLGLVLGLGLVVAMLTPRTGRKPTVLAGLLMAGSLTWASDISQESCRVLPDGRPEFRKYAPSIARPPAGNPVPCVQLSGRMNERGLCNHKIFRASYRDGLTMEVDFWIANDSRHASIIDFGLSRLPEIPSLTETRPLVSMRFHKDSSPPGRIVLTLGSPDSGHQEVKEVNPRILPCKAWNRARIRIRPDGIVEFSLRRAGKDFAPVWTSTRAVDPAFNGKASFYFLGNGGNVTSSYIDNILILDNASQPLLAEDWSGVDGLGDTTWSTLKENLNNLAYLDTTHLERNDNESWRPNGLMGLKLTLMRNGFQVLECCEFTLERLKRAGLVVSVAPHRAFTRAEVDCIKDFVAGGGIFILMASYPDCEPSRNLLEAFAFEVGVMASAPGLEPQPMGHFKSPYYNPGDTMNHVRFHEAWPVACTAPNTPSPGWKGNPKPGSSEVLRFTNWFLHHGAASVFPWMKPLNPARVIAYGTGNYPVILLRPMGKGKFVVIGDTCFAMNKNLENRGGQPFEGLRENADFWRWFLADLRGQEPWYPPKPIPVPEERREE